VFTLCVMRRIVVLAVASLGAAFAAPGGAYACHPVPYPTPPGYYDHGCGDNVKGIKAASSSVTVGDNFFQPATVRIAAGDQVNWTWQGTDQHNVVTTSGQTERFRSRLQSSGSFSHTFANRGRFTYLCEVHPSEMRGAVEVGPPPFPDTILPRLRGLRAAPSPGVVKLTFRLSEAATVTASLRGATRKRVRRRLRRGRRSITIRGLHAGRHRATLVARDGAGNRSRAAVARFGVPR
jgi:plastocyanin